MLAIFRFIFKLVFKIVGVALTVYFGLVLMFFSTVAMQQQLEREYRASLIRPLVNASSFDQWNKMSYHLINNPAQQSWWQDWQIRLAYPGLHDEYLRLNNEVEQLQQETLRLATQLNQAFDENPLLERTWEMIVLKQQNQDEMDWKDIANGFGSFIKSPQQQSQLLSEYSEHARRIALLGQSLMKMNHRLQHEAADILPFNGTRW